MVSYDVTIVRLKLVPTMKNLRGQKKIEIHFEKRREATRFHFLLGAVRKLVSRGPNGAGVDIHAH